MISSNWGLFPFRYRLNWDKLQIPKIPGDSLEFLISNLIFLVAGRVFYKLFSHYYSNPTFKLRNKESIPWILRVYLGDWKYLWYVFTIFFLNHLFPKSFYLKEYNPSKNRLLTHNIPLDYPNDVILKYSTKKFWLLFLSILSQVYYWLGVYHQQILVSFLSLIFQIVIFGNYSQN